MARTATFGITGRVSRETLDFIGRLMDLEPGESFTARKFPSTAYLTMAVALGGLGRVFVSTKAKTGGRVVQRLPDGTEVDRRGSQPSRAIELSRRLMAMQPGESMSLAGWDWQERNARNYLAAMTGVRFSVTSFGDDVVRVTRLAGDERIVTRLGAIGLKKARPSRTLGVERKRWVIVLNDDRATISGPHGVVVARNAGDVAERTMFDLAREVCDRRAARLEYEEACRGR